MAGPMKCELSLRLFSPRLEPGSRPIEAWNDVSYDAVRAQALISGAKENSKYTTYRTTDDADVRIIILRFAVADEIFAGERFNVPMKNKKRWVLI
ncbi:hypothetical protein CEXT_737151 [Caerostris extrusa]|uniref:Uncharacterized protein n=1 Tax=Caerostris extrusa TaxID=172846 RepID=A0AAV4UEK2_CAEEX|nr:hypothetical protein CEXT_737151 [Caerostris extrusa]